MKLIGKRLGSKMVTLRDDVFLFGGYESRSKTYPDEI